MIMATPCDGIIECRDGRDENCEEDKLILLTTFAVLFLTTICIYIYLVVVRIPHWEKTVFRNFTNRDETMDLKSFIFTDIKGNELAKLKVCKLNNDNCK